MQATAKTGGFVNMQEYNVYEDMSSRAGGGIYVGVVGPVRTGKSTFIKRLMERLVIPYAAEGSKKIMVDELPQSGAGKTVMTTEPKFVPAEPAEIALKEGVTAKIRLVDCVFLRRRQNYVHRGASSFHHPRGGQNHRYG